MTADEVEQAKEALIKQKPLNKFYWTSEYGNMQPAFKSGDIWITYSWPNDYKDMGRGPGKVEFMQSRRRASWLGVRVHAGQGHGQSPTTRTSTWSRSSTHDGVRRPGQPVRYGSADSTVQASEIKDQALATKLKIGDPEALNGADVNIEQWMPNEDEVRSGPGQEV